MLKFMRENPSARFDDIKVSFLTHMRNIPVGRLTFAKATKSEKKALLRVIEKSFPDDTCKKLKKAFGV